MTELSVEEVAARLIFEAELRATTAPTWDDLSDADRAVYIKMATVVIDYTIDQTMHEIVKVETDYRKLGTAGILAAVLRLRDHRRPK